MVQKDLERIVKTFYDTLEEGKILGRKCMSCGHVEYPPYLACNTCGSLDTEWCEISGKAVATQIQAPAAVYADPEFGKRVGDYCIASIKPDESDEINTCLIGVNPNRLDELRAKLPMPVKPVILQEDGYKMVFWELDE